MARTATTRAATGTVLLLHGDERFLIDEAARSTLEVWKPELVSDFGFDTLEGTGLTTARLQDSILQLPFLDPYRAVFVRMLPATRAESMAPALADIPPTTRLLITVAGRLSPGNKLVKAVTSAGGTAQEMQHLKGRALSDWTTRRAVDVHGLTPAIAAQVVRVTPPDLSVVDSELSKLAAYKASGSKLTSEAVTELLAGGREDEIFKLTDNLLPHPTPQAMQIARGLTRGGLQPTTVAYRMARHVALVLEVRARQERGQSLQQVQDGMAEHRFVVQKAYDAAQNADPDRLEAALRAIRDYEWEVKSGQVDAEWGLDVLLTRL
jgi:DNA polymerase III subunit delta